MTYEFSNTPALINTNIDVPRLFTDLALTEEAMRELAALPIPDENTVTSVSSIKGSTISDVLHIVQPQQEFAVTGIKAPSDVAEQPLGQTAIDGALNRLQNGINMRTQAAESKTPLNPTGWFSVENGLFRVQQQAPTLSLPQYRDGIIINTSGADLEATFDPSAEYEDRAVAAIKIPGYPTIVEVSPHNEAVRFYRAAVHAAYNAEGGFGQWTAGSKLREMGFVIDKQNPHTELTYGRAGGPLPRQDQMARVVIRGLMQLTQRG